MINALVNGNWKRKKEVSEGGRKEGKLGFADFDYLLNQNTQI